MHNAWPLNTNVMCWLEMATGSFCIQVGHSWAYEKGVGPCTPCENFLFKNQAMHKTSCCHAKCQTSAHITCKGCLNIVYYLVQ